MKQITIRLDDETHKALRYLSIDIDKSINEYVIDLIKKDLANRRTGKEK